MCMYMYTYVHIASKIEKMNKHTQKKASFGVYLFTC